MHSSAGALAAGTSPALSDRSRRLLAGLSIEDRLIEIGPSFNPVAPKMAGWKTVVVDHGSRADLVAKYAQPLDRATSIVTPGSSRRRASNS